MFVTVKFKFISEDIFQIKIWNGYNMQNLIHSIKQIIGSNIENERIILYDNNRERIDFMNFINEDEYIIYSGDHFKIDISDLDEQSESLDERSESLDEENNYNIYNNYDNYKTKKEDI